MGETAFGKKVIGKAQKKKKKELEALLHVELKENFIEEFCQFR
jgi:hypothetical protein